MSDPLQDQHLLHHTLSLGLFTLDIDLLLLGEGEIRLVDRFDSHEFTGELVHGKVNLAESTLA